MSRKKGGLVYSTSSEAFCSHCENPEDNCICDILSTGPAQTEPAAHSEVIKIRRETKGRAGKTVTTITGIPLIQQKELSAKLKQHCGTGGSVKENVIIIQGDHRAKIKSYIEKEGYVVKLAGG